MKERTREVDGGKEMRASDCYHGYLVQQLFDMPWPEIGDRYLCNNATQLSLF